MSDPDSAPPRLPVAAALRAWLALPDVLADPHQREDGRVWTRAQDVLPHATLRPGRAVVACWGETTWQALPEWDDLDPSLLWLRPLTASVDVPSPAAAHRLDSRQGACGETDLAELVDDFDLSVEVLMQTIRTYRSLARALLRQIGQDLPPRSQARLLDSAAGRQLFALARRARLPGGTRAD
ncbi:hypothetical protein [Oryzihumus leptocrescens]|uniref:Uncharacterized protein n=1 Tax=Oryzihumus leptocrescens TaxID=297536 RepID=A0A542ZIG8_9MICO|nr:hypothetical protein [Oryzihumus leptocrescens]TQL60134.1 hypothetical protein FB474_1517 [Oryzihumus leptocrescens]